MAETDHWICILNPKAGSGRGARHWEKISRLLRKEGILYEVRRTEAPEHATQLARQAIHQGFRKLIAVGGDGTANEVANGILTNPDIPPTEVAMGVIPVGTGNDWGRTIGIPSHYIAAVNVIRKGKTTLTDVGKVIWQVNGEEKERFFVNMAGLGFDGFVGEYINPRKARGKGGSFSYIYGILVSLFRYKSSQVKVEFPGGSLKRAVFTMMVGICKYNGGGMKTCPDAVYNDGLLDLTLVGKIPRWKVILNFPRLFTGSFVRLNEVDQLQLKELNIISEGHFPLEVDGDNLGSGPAKFRILSRALSVIVK